MRFLLLTRIHYRLPLAAPLAELLSVLFFYLCSLHEAGHEVVAGLVGMLSSVHCINILSWLGREAEKCQHDKPFGWFLNCSVSGDFHLVLNPHHPEALFLGILRGFLGEARHFWDSFCLGKHEIAVCVIQERVARLVKMHDKCKDSFDCQPGDTDYHGTGWTSALCNM